MLQKNKPPRLSNPHGKGLRPYNAEVSGGSKPSHHRGVIGVHDGVFAHVIVQATAKPKRKKQNEPVLQKPATFEQIVSAMLNTKPPKKRADTKNK